MPGASIVSQVRIRARPLPADALEQQLGQWLASTRQATGWLASRLELLDERGDDWLLQVKWRSAGDCFAHYRRGFAALLHGGLVRQMGFTLVEPPFEP